MGSRAASSKPERKRKQQTQFYQSDITKTTRNDSAYRNRETIMTQPHVATHTTMPYSGQRKDLELLEKMQFKYDSISKASTASMSLDTITAVPHQKAMQTRKSSDNWEIKAKKGIDRKGLRLDRDWNEKTWMNKSNRNERLKLLKDDGVDITPLQGAEIAAKLSLTSFLLMLPRTNGTVHSVCRR